MAQIDKKKNNNVASKIAIFESSSPPNNKPAIPKKNVRYINGRVVYLQDSNHDNTDHGGSNNSLNNSIKEKSDTDSDADGEGVSKLNSITNECVNFINLVLKSLSILMGFKAALADKFQDNKEISGFLLSVFRDIEPLQMLYKLVLEKLNKLKNQGSFSLPDLFLDKEVRGLLNIYKTFLSQYSINAKWIGEFVRSNALCQEVCRQAKEEMSVEDNITPDSCLYTVFNSLFSFELIINRYSQCFEEGQESRLKAEEVKLLISSLLNTINSNLDQSNFLMTHKELNLITGKIRETKITTRFICKGIATKLSRRDDKALSRQLILFSDCLYVTLLPGNISGTSSVRQELSLDSMVIFRLVENEERRDNLKWGLNIYAREADQDFYFDDEETLTTWLTKLQAAIGDEKKTNSNNQANLRSNHTFKIGDEAPRWQKDSAAGYCNGYKCNMKFSSTVRRHHCRADGLLYCDKCCSSKVKLAFERVTESRVCDICCRILLGDLSRPTELAEAKRQLELVFDKKTRKGMKTDWLQEAVFNQESRSFGSYVKYFCELDLKDPFLNLYEKQEDKTKHHGIMLLGMIIRVRKESKHCKKLKPNQFIIEHQDKTEAYLFNASSAGSCDEWVACLRESINNYCNTE